MKQRLITWLEGAILAFCMGFSAVGCLSTAFSLPMVDHWLLAVLCALTAVLGGFFYCFSLSLVPLGALALSAGFLWQSGMLEAGLEALLYRVSAVYHGGYHWPIVQWSGTPVEQMDANLPGFVYLLGILLTLAAVWTVCRGKSCLWTCLPAMVPVLACFVVTDTLPSIPLLFLFMAVFLVLMLTSHSRQVDTRQANRLTPMMAIPVVLALGILFLAVPESTYQGQEQAKNICQSLFGDSPLERLWDQLTGQTAYTGTSLDGGTVDLTRIGLRIESSAEVMRVNTRYTGKLYLRGRALDGYSGTQWYDTQTQWDLNWPGTVDMDYLGNVVISTKYAHRMLYVPYYIQNLNTMHMYRGLENEERLSMYSFSVRLPPDSSVLQEHYRNWKRVYAYDDPDDSIPEALHQWAQDTLEQCTQLPESTRKWAQELVAQIIQGETDHYEIVRLIGNYVRNSARYDLETRRMPKRQTDFVRWFLESGETGYCVHFASAATVLLKAAGIPARYVSGYVAYVQDGMTAVVRGKDAHAWVEYWLPGYGWTILEATPALEEDPEQTTAPTQQQESVAPTRPEQNATLPEQTAPTDSQAERMPGYSGEAEDPAWLVPVCWLLGILGALALILGQWRLRLRLRLGRFTKGDPNQRTLAWWQETLWLCRLLKKQAPAELYELAQKAKFSQYVITPEELAQFVFFRKDAVRQLKKRNIFRQLWDRIVLAAY